MGNLGSGSKVPVHHIWARSLFCFTVLNDLLLNVIYNFTDCLIIAVVFCFSIGLHCIIHSELNSNG